MIKKNSILNEYRPGTYQSDRMPEALNPKHVKIDGRTFDQLVKQCQMYASRLNFVGDDLRENGNWSVFFNSICSPVSDEDGNVSMQYDSQILEELAEKGAVPAHLGLLLAFLKLFGIEQEYLNSYVERHLDFYYKELLRFAPSTGTAGTVPVTFELNKNCQETMVAAGTAFSAGKTDDGKEITYICPADTVINHAQVAAILRTDYDELGSVESNVIVGDFDICGTYGFMISSELLQPLQGNCIITFTKTTTTEVEDSGLQPFNLLSCFDVEYTAACGWMPCRRSGDNFVVPSEEPMANYDCAIHGAGFSLCRPLLRFTLKECPSALKDKLSTLTPNDIRISSVTYLDVKDLELTNENGIVPNAEGGRLFSIQPGVGTNAKVKIPLPEHLIRDVQLSVEWQSPAVTGSDSSFWNTDGSKASLIGADGKIVKIFTEYVSKNEVTLSVTHDFGYSTFRTSMMKAVIEVSAGREAELPLNPFVPVLASPITANITLGGDQDAKYISFTPFGKVSAKEKLLEERFGDGFGRHIYLGISSLAAGNVLCLYFKMGEKFIAEHTSQTVEEGPELYMLSGNSWEKAEKGIILSDTTSGMRKSGTLRLAPIDCCLQQHELMQSDLAWIRISYRKSASNFPPVQAVTAQTIEMTPGENVSALPQMWRGLPAGTIAKSLMSIRGVRTTTQLYDGAEGTEPESVSSFRCRVSERLRHKGRAWNSWDYERLVLSAFPSLEAVKCVPCTDAEGNYAPGHVMVMLVPSSRGEGAQRLCPSLGSSTLKDVADYLQTRMSPFVKLHVTAPKYVSITVYCKLSLKPGFADATYHAEQISRELVSFIAPWASGGDVSMIRRLSLSNILYFIENIECVDYIRELNVKVGDREIFEGEEITPTDNCVIMTSAPEHNIIVI